MTDGVLGMKVLDENGEFTGQFEENSIPGAADDGEVIDTRFRRARCEIGSYSRRGPGGIATYFEPDTRTATSTIEYGEPQVRVDGARTCVILPRTLIVKVKGTKTYYNWYDVCCTLVFSDCITELEWIKEEQEEEVVRKTPLDPLITCHTDFGELLLDLFEKLVEQGAKQVDLQKLLGQLAPVGRALPPEVEKELAALRKSGEAKPPERVAKAVSSPARRRDRE